LPTRAHHGESEYHPPTLSWIETPDPPQDSPHSCLRGSPSIMVIDPHRCSCQIRRPMYLGINPGVSACTLSPKCFTNRPKSRCFLIRDTRYAVHTYLPHKHPSKRQTHATQNGAHRLRGPPIHQRLRNLLRICRLLDLNLPRLDPRRLLIIRLQMVDERSVDELWLRVRVSCALERLEIHR